MPRLKWTKKTDRYGNVHHISEDNLWDIVKLSPYTDVYRVYDLEHPRFTTRIMGGYLPEDRIEVQEKTYNRVFQKLGEAKKWVEIQR